MEIGRMNKLSEYSLNDLSFMMHCEAMAGPPADDPYLQYAQVRRHIVIYKRVRWLQVYSQPHNDAWNYRNEHRN